MAWGQPFCSENVSAHAANVTKRVALGEFDGPSNVWAGRIVYRGRVASAAVDRLKETGFESHEPMPAMTFDVRPSALNVTPSSTTLGRPPDLFFSALR